MAMLFNQNYPSSKNQQSQDHHPCFDCKHKGVAALPDIKALTAKLPPQSGSSKYLFHELIK